MKKLVPRVANLSIGFVALVLFQNCAKTKFSSSADASSSQALALPGQPDSNGFKHSSSSCYYELHSATVPVKLIFVVDTSGSNGGFYRSDPDKVVRGKSIEQFFTDYKAKTNFKWGFDTFQDTVATALISDGTNAKFGNVPEMQNAISLFNTITDSKDTPYRAAISMAINQISSDPSYSANTKYLVLFLSDGLPTDYSNDSAGDSLLVSDVQTLVGIRPGKITFNTIYYGDADPAASNRLHMMANAGSGQFLDTNNNPSGKSFSISDTISVPGSSCAP